MYLFIWSIFNHINVELILIVIVSDKINNIYPKIVAKLEGLRCRAEFLRLAENYACNFPGSAG